MHAGIFENVAFSMRFGLLSIRKLLFRSLKTDLLENSSEGEDTLKLHFQCWRIDRENRVFGLWLQCVDHYPLCLHEATFCAVADVAKIVLVLTLLTGLFYMFTHKCTVTRFYNCIFWNNSTSLFHTHDSPLSQCAIAGCLLEIPFLQASDWPTWL